MKYIKLLLLLVLAFAVVVSSTAHAEDCLEAYIVNSFIEVPQYQTKDIVVKAKNFCTGTRTFRVSTTSDLPVSIEPRTFSLGRSVEQTIHLSVSPLNINTGFYSLDVSVASSNEVDSLHAAVQVTSGSYSGSGGTNSYTGEGGNQVFSGSFVEVSQYDVVDIAVLFSNPSSSSKNYVVTIESEIPLILRTKTLTISANSNAQARFTLNPGSTKAGLYEITVNAGSLEKSVIVKVVPSDQTVLRITEVPAVVRSLSTEDLPMLIGVKNSGQATLDNVGIYLEREGERVFTSTELFSLSAEEEKLRVLTVTGLEEGENRLTVTVYSGSLLYSKDFNVVIGKSRDVQSSVVIEEFEDNDRRGYTIRYDLRNDGIDELKGVYLTVEDAPQDWEVISSVRFNLKKDQTRSAEVTLIYGEQATANITIALYTEAGLLIEDEVVLSPASVGRLTGLVIFGNTSFGLGFLATLFLVALYLGIKLKKKAEDKGLDLTNRDDLESILTGRRH